MDASSEALAGDVAELLEASAGFVEAKATADRLHDRVVRIARRLANDNALTDEQAIRAAGHFASEVLRKGTTLEAASATPRETT